MDISAQGPYFPISMGNNWPDPHPKVVADCLGRCSRRPPTRMLRLRSGDPLKKEHVDIRIRIEAAYRLYGGDGHQCFHMPTPLGVATSRAEDIREDGCYAST